VLYDVIIVGGSAAGLTAALYSARLGLTTLVITKDIGGQMLLTNEIQNYPGFELISGFELANRLKEQAELYGAQFIYEEVVGIEEDRECPGLCFRVRTTRADYHSTAIILALGKTPKDLGVPGEQELKGRGVSYCAVCDGPLFKGKTVAVVGSGDQALEAVNYLAKVAANIYLIHNYDMPIGSEDMVRQVLSLPNVKAIPNSKVLELKGSSKLEKAIISNTKSGEIRELALDAIFIEIGYVARTEFLRGFVQLNSKNEVITDKEGNTSRQGVFAAGDVTDTPYKQAVISAGQGCAAALSAYNYIQRLRGRTAVRSDWRVIKPVAKKA
jgi:thioredoxin reductase (NADPH)